MGHLALYIDGTELNSVFSAMADGHVSYGLGKKAQPLSVPTKSISAIDCSGFVRYLLYQVCDLQIPDGSYVQNDWCGLHLAPGDYEEDAGGRDNLLRIAFIRPSKTIRVGHVWLVLNGLTMESHGGHGGGTQGPDRRPWDNRWLLPDVTDCYELGMVWYPSRAPSNPVWV